MITDQAAIKWGFDRKITTVGTGYMEGEGAHIQLLDHQGEILRISTVQFNSLFELSLGKNQTICRLRQEQQMKAEISAQTKIIEQTEMRELKRLQEKYK